MKQITNEFGQTILILILVLTAGLAIGISVVQRSLSDISTSSKVEQSSRAFSAAEAGIERALSGGSIGLPISIGDNSSATVTEPLGSGDLPLSGQALEYPPLSKEELAHFWLCKPSDMTGCYGRTNLTLYWGLTGADKPAIEITIIYGSPSYATRKIFLDADASRVNSNGFTSVSSSCTGSKLTGVSKGATFLCEYSLTGLPSDMKIIRARLLYNNTPQPIAIKPESGYSLPQQARVFESTGVAGDTQRKVQVFKLDKVVPFYFDYALFSVGAVSKN